MSFIKENGTAALLLAAIFMSLGFVLGKVTDCKKGHRGCQKGKKSHCDKSRQCSHGSQNTHSDCAVWVSDCAHCFDFDSEHGGEMIIVKSLMEDGFEGDTVINIPGCEIIIKIIDGEVEVDVEIEEEHHSHDEISHEIHKEVRVVKVVEE